MQMDLQKKLRRCRNQCRNLCKTPCSSLCRKLCRNPAAWVKMTHAKAMSSQNDTVWYNRKGSRTNSRNRRRVVCSLVCRNRAETSCSNLVPKGNLPRKQGTHRQLVIDLA